MNNLKEELALLLHKKICEDNDNQELERLLSLSEEQLDVMLGNYYLYEIKIKNNYEKIS